MTPPADPKPRKWYWAIPLAVLIALAVSVVVAGVLYFASARLFDQPPAAGQAINTTPGQTTTTTPPAPTPPSAPAVTAAPAVVALLAAILSFIGVLTAQIMGWRFAISLETRKAELQRDIGNIQVLVQGKGVDYKLARERRFADQLALSKMASEIYMALRDYAEGTVVPANFDAWETIRRLKDTRSTLGTADRQFDEIWRRQAQLALAMCEAIVGESKAMTPKNVWAKIKNDYARDILALQGAIQHDIEQALTLPGR